MSFRIRQAASSDLPDLHALASSQAAHGFLTLPTAPSELEALLERSRLSFAGSLPDPDRGCYVFVLEDLAAKRVVGSSLIVARHGSPQEPHHFFEVDEKTETLQLVSETRGRTELGGLVLEKGYRGHPEKLGKRLSYARLFYIARHPKEFRSDLLAELLPPFTPEGKSPFWEGLGRRLTGLEYAEADVQAKQDPYFIPRFFPSGPVPIASLPPEARAVIGVPGPETVAVTKILKEAGFRYLHHIDPFDGGPHYGAGQKEIRQDLIEDFLKKKTEVKIEGHL